MREILFSKRRSARPLGVSRALQGTKKAPPCWLGLLIFSILVGTWFQTTRFLRIGQTFTAFLSQVISSLVHAAPQWMHSAVHSPT